MARLFGTDGVRGVANQELTPDLAFQLGFAAAHVLAEDKPLKKTVLVGRDTRISGEMLESALVAGLCSAGADAIVAGVVSTPGVAWLTRSLGCDAGAVISASHNPFEYNGIKFFSREGYKCPDDVEDEIEASIRSFKNEAPRPVGKEIGRRSERHELAWSYAQNLLEHFGLDLSGMKIGLDCANGAAFESAPRIFRELGADLLLTGVEPDGLNINRGVGSTHIEHLAELVRKNQLDLGLAFDGDADRLIAVDDKGEVVDGDVMMAVLALDMKKHGELHDNALVVTVMSNLAVDIFAKENGIKLLKTKVGDRYVLEEMLKYDYSLGGEQSGHMIFLQDATTGDGQLSALKLLHSIKRSNEKLSELRKIIRILPQVLINAKVPDDKKSSCMQDPDVLAASQRIRDKLGDKGRLLLRPSGTEPYVRVMLEGEDHDEIQDLAEGLANLINSKFAS